MIDYRYLVFLAVSAAATVFFSMFNTPGIRGFRNFGFLTIYIGTVVWLFFATFSAVAMGWCVFGIGSGVIYYLYEVVSTARSADHPKEWPSPTTVLHGLFAWPIMLPEAIEYSLADMGILKATPIPADTQEETDVSAGSP